MSAFFLFSEVFFLATDLRAVLYFKSLLFCFGVKAAFPFDTLQQHSETQSMKSLSASLITQVYKISKNFSFFYGNSHFL